MQIMDQWNIFRAFFAKLCSLYLLYINCELSIFGLLVRGKTYNVSRCIHLLSIKGKTLKIDTQCIVINFEGSKGG